MRIFQFITIVVFTFCISCKQEKPIQTKEESPELPDDFQTFYDKFHTDTAFQLSHIIFPLQGYPAVTDSAQYVPENFTWAKEKWILHRPFDNAGGEFKRSFLNFNDIITEEISDRSGQFKMLRRFSKMDNEWFLIYYKEMGL